ncbi:hypothetical protein L218DRAFT_445078 [Marasmius fiardii PR-910]|nr:hypothetical protein L218DRAFT_445078 [Marasmius fiardii PR-910]
MHHSDEGHMTFESTARLTQVKKPVKRSGTAIAHSSLDMLRIINLHTSPSEKTKSMTSLIFNARTAYPLSTHTKKRNRNLIWPPNVIRYARVFFYTCPAEYKVGQPAVGSNPDNQVIQISQLRQRGTAQNFNHSIPKRTSFAFQGTIPARVLAEPACVGCSYSIIRTDLATSAFHTNKMDP